MKNIFLVCLLFVTTTQTKSQDNISPAPPQKETIALTHAAIHIGNGQVIEDGMIVFSKGKIVDVNTYSAIIDNVKIIDCSGKHIYPGLISANTNLGLNEISGVRATRDEYELGDIK